MRFSPCLFLLALCARSLFAIPTECYNFLDPDLGTHRSSLSQAEAEIAGETQKAIEREMKLAGLKGGLTALRRVERPGYIYWVNERDSIVVARKLGKATLAYDSFGALSPSDASELARAVATSDDAESSLDLTSLTQKAAGDKTLWVDQKGRILAYKTLGKDEIVFRKHLSWKQGRGEGVEVDFAVTAPKTIQPRLDVVAIYGPDGLRSRLVLGFHYATSRGVKGQQFQQEFIVGKTPYVLQIEQYRAPVRWMVATRPTRSEQRQRTLQRKSERELKTLRRDGVEAPIPDSPARKTQEERDKTELESSGPLLWRRTEFRSPTIYEGENGPVPLDQRILSNTFYGFQSKFVFERDVLGNSLFTARYWGERSIEARKVAGGYLVSRDGGRPVFQPKNPIDRQKAEAMVREEKPFRAGTPWIGPQPRPTPVALTRVSQDASESRVLGSAPNPTVTALFAIYPIRLVTITRYP